MERCYANCLGDCSGKLSREHYVSQGLIKLAQDDPNSILLGGRLDIGVPTSSKNLAVSKILCSAHNSELSVVDAEAVRLATTIFDWNQSGGTVEETFDGDLLVRWSCKSLLGQRVAAGDTRPFAGRLTSETVCRWSFGRDRPPASIGMAVPNGTVSFPEEAKMPGGMPSWVVSCLSDPFGRQAGYRTWFYPLEFEVDLRGHPSFSQRSRFKPGKLIFRSIARRSELTLNVNWYEWEGGTVTFPLG